MLVYMFFVVSLMNLALEHFKLMSINENRHRFNGSWWCILYKKHCLSTEEKSIPLKNCVNTM